MLPHRFRVTKYDPDDRDENGWYQGTEDVFCDFGPVEQAYIDAVRGFAEDSGVTMLAIREPCLPGEAHFGTAPIIDGYGLAGLFPPDHRGFHDGALVTLDVGLELVRAMLRDNGVGCNLEAEGQFSVEIGYDQYMYVRSHVPCDRAFHRTAELGLFAEIDWREEEEAEEGPPRPADAAFWAEVDSLVQAVGALVLEEQYVGNRFRWHPLTSATVAGVRAGLTPRSCLRVLPDLSTDVAGLLATVEHDAAHRLVWENRAAASAAPPSPSTTAQRCIGMCPPAGERSGSLIMKRNSPRC